MRHAGFHSHRAAKKGDGLAPAQSIDPHVPTGFEDRILLKLANRGRGVLGLRSALAGPGMSGCVKGFGRRPSMRALPSVSGRQPRYGPPGGGHKSYAGRVTSHDFSGKPKRSFDLLVLQKLIECPANDVVAFARSGFQPLAADDLDASASIAYQAPRLQRLCSHCHAGSAQP